MTGDLMIDAMVADGDVIVLERQNVARNGDMVAVYRPNGAKPRSRNTI